MDPIARCGEQQQRREVYPVLGSELDRLLGEAGELDLDVVGALGVVSATQKGLRDSSPVVTMTVYAHVLPSHDERLTGGLEATFREARA